MFKFIKDLFSKKTEEKLPSSTKPKTLFHQIEDSLIDLENLKSKDDSDPQAIALTLVKLGDLYYKSDKKKVSFQCHE